jgi:uncharacterized protein YndB with AHSA1/START domain
MALKLQITTMIARPLADVFDFFAVNHVRNHPRWDPDIELQQITEGPIRVGTMIRRRNSRFGTTVEGTMEVVEYVPNQALGMLIHDGPNVTHGRTVFEAIDDQHTSFTTYIEIPWMDENADTSFMLSRLERSSHNQKQLMESDE